MAKTIPIGIFTNQGGAHLGAYFESLADCDFADDVILCDPSGNSVDAARKALGEKLAAVFTEPDKALNNAKPEMALVSLEAAQAPPIIDKVLDAGCHVFAEKPACVNAADFTKLVNKASQKKQHLMLALANRINPPVLKARELIDSGMFGTPFGIEIHMVADQTRLKSESYHQSWYADRKRAGGGHLIWLGIHWLDLAMLFMDSDIRQVSGFAGNVGGQPIKAEDSAALSMKFDNGTFGTMTSGYYLDKGYHSHIRMWGSKGWIEYSEWLGGANPTPLSWYTPETGIREYDGLREPRGYTPWVNECVKASAGLREAPITGEEGLRVLKTIFAFYEAAEEGRTVTV